MSSAATAQIILAEIGADMSRFPTPEHLVSWAKLYPRTIQSGAKNTAGPAGQGNPWLKGALDKAANAAAHASLVDRDDELGMGSGPLETALAGGERLHGQRMDGFDLAVMDEAHGTAGDPGRAWAAIHDNTRIPARLPALPHRHSRILAAARPQHDRDGRELEIASMADDPNSAFGRWKLGLSEAITREILAAFEIDLLEIRDPEPVPELSEEALRDRRPALLQTALLEQAAAHNLRTVMTFHQRVEEAEAFANKLPKTAAALYTAVQRR